MRIEFSQEVACPIAEVFAYLTDPERLHEWQGKVETEQLTDGPLGKGTRMRETRHFLGRNIEQIVEVSEYEQPTRFSLEIIEGPVPVDGHHVLEEVEGATRINVRAEGDLHGFAHFAEPMLRRNLERRLRGYYERLRSNLEAG